MKNKCTNEKVSPFDSGSLRAACFGSYEFEGSRIQLQGGCGTGILRARLLPWRLLRSRVWVLLLPTRLLPPRQLSRLLLWQRLLEEKTRNGILSTLSVNPPRKQRMSFRQ